MLGTVGKEVAIGLGRAIVRRTVEFARAEVALVRWIVTSSRDAFAEARRNPKRLLIKSAAVLPLAFAFYVMYLHSPAAAAGPGPSCQAWATSEASTPGPLSQALSNMTGGSTVSTWMNNAVVFVGVIFWALMVVQLTQDIIDYMFQTAGAGTLGGFFGQYGRVLLMNLLIAGLFVNLPSITYDFFSSASQAGQAVTGVAPAPWYSNIFNFQPGIISDEGVCVQDEMDTAFYTLANKKMQLSWTNIGQSLQAVMEYVTAWFSEFVGASVVNIAYLIIAVVFTFVALEVFFIAGLGMITLGGMSHRALWFMPMGYRAAAFSLFMKIAALGAISAFGVQEADTWAQMIAGATSLEQLVPICKEIMYGGIGFALLGGFMPGIIGKHFGGAYMGQQATMAIGRVGSTTSRPSSPQQPQNGSSGGGGGNGSTQRANQTPTMSGTP